MGEIKSSGEYSMGGDGAGSAGGDRREKTFKLFKEGEVMPNHEQYLNMARDLRNMPSQAWYDEATKKPEVLEKLENMQAALARASNVSDRNTAAEFFLKRAGSGDIAHAQAATEGFKTYLEHGFRIQEDPHKYGVEKKDVPKILEAQAGHTANLQHELYVDASSAPAEERDGAIELNDSFFQYSLDFSAREDTVLPAFGPGKPNSCFRKIFDGLKRDWDSMVEHAKRGGEDAERAKNRLSVLRRNKEAMSEFLSGNEKLRELVDDLPENWEDVE